MHIVKNKHNIHSNALRGLYTYGNPFLQACSAKRVLAKDGFNGVKQLKQKNSGQRRIKSAKHMSLFMCVDSMIFMDGDFQVVLLYQNRYMNKDDIKMIYIDEQKQFPVACIHSKITDKVHEYIADHVLLPKLREKSDKKMKF